MTVEEYISSCALSIHSMFLFLWGYFINCRHLIAWLLPLWGPISLVKWAALYEEMTYRAARIQISCDRWWTSAGCMCAFVHASTLSADVFQRTMVIDERLWHRIIPWNQMLCRREKTFLSKPAFLFLLLLLFCIFLCVFKHHVPFRLCFQNGFNLIHFLSLPEGKR